MITDDQETLAREDTPKQEGAFGYRQITAALIEDIKSSRWALGEQLPTEAELVDRFDVSRNTIRESLRELEVFGYIRRRRGTRSVLLSSNPTDSFVNSVQSIGELLQYSTRTGSRVISVEMVVATPALSERLGVKLGSQWLRLEILRMPLRGELPLGFSEIYVDGRYAEHAERFRELCLVYRVLENELGVNFRRVEQMIEAAAATPPIAEYLQIPVGSPLLAVRTEFITSAGEIAEIGFGHFPAKRYRMEIVLKRGQTSLAES